MAVASSHFPYWPVPAGGIPTEDPDWNVFMPSGVNAQGIWPSGVVLEDGRMLVMWLEATGGELSSDWACYQKYIQADEICGGNISSDGARLLAYHDSTTNAETQEWEELGAVVGTMPNGRMFLCIAARWDLVPVSIAAPPNTLRTTNLWVSDDDGATWQFLSEIVPSLGSPDNLQWRSTAVGGEIVVHPGSGRWLFITPMYDDGAQSGLNIPESRIFSTTDAGVTWEEETTGYHFAYGRESGRNFGMSTNGRMFWSQNNEETVSRNRLWWSTSGRNWTYQGVSRISVSLMAWADQETMWSLDGRVNEEPRAFREMAQPLPANPYPVDFPGDVAVSIAKREGDPPLVQWGSGTRVHVFSRIEVACWGEPSIGCPAPTLLHIPYKKWGLPGAEEWEPFQWTQNQLRIERWTMQNEPDWDQLHLPYDMVFAPAHAEMNYLRLERYAQTQSCNCHPLHIPYKKWAYGENPPGWQEDINYLTIERWVKGLVQCSGGGELSNYNPPVRPPTAPGTCTYPSLSTFPSLTTYPCGGN